MDLGCNPIRARLLAGIAFGLNDFDYIPVGEGPGNEAAGRIRNVDSWVRITVIVREKPIEPVRVLAALRIIARGRNVIAGWVRSRCA